MSNPTEHLLATFLAAREDLVDADLARLVDACEADPALAARLANGLATDNLLHQALAPENRDFTRRVVDHACRYRGDEVFAARVVQRRQAHQWAPLAAAAALVMGTGLVAFAGRAPVGDETTRPSVDLTLAPGASVLLDDGSMPAAVAVRLDRERGTRSVVAGSKRRVTVSWQPHRPF